VHDLCPRHHMRKCVREDLVTDVEAHVHVNGPWKDKLSELSDEPAVTAVVEHMAAEEHTKVAACVYQSHMDRFRLNLGRMLPRIRLPSPVGSITMARHPQSSVLGLAKTADAATATLCKALCQCGCEKSGACSTRTTYATYIRSRARFQVIFRPHAAADISSWQPSLISMK
jgi:hypothetical protein